MPIEHLSTLGSTLLTDDAYESAPLERRSRWGCWTLCAAAVCASLAASARLEDQRAADASKALAATARFQAHELSSILSRSSAALASAALEAQALAHEGIDPFSENGAGALAHALGSAPQLTDVFLMPLDAARTSSRALGGALSTRRPPPCPSQAESPAFWGSTFHVKLPPEGSIWMSQPLLDERGSPNGCAMGLLNPNLLAKALSKKSWAEILTVDAASLASSPELESLDASSARSLARLAKTQGHATLTLPDGSQVAADRAGPFLAVARAVPAAASPAHWALAACCAVFCAGVFAFKTLVQSRVRARRGIEREARAANDALGSAIDERTAELGHALASLRRAQSEAMRASKLSTLGSLVAGVSHELNTPLGNANVATSAMLERFERLTERFEQGGIKKSELDAHFRDTLELAQVALDEAARCQKLAASFKQISVDQTSQRSRSFDLADVARDVAESFAPQLRSLPGKIQLRVDARPAPARGQAGLAAEALTLMLQNCLCHAFVGRDEGCISMVISVEGSDVRAEVVDDGVGVQAHDLPKIFDPFFTTAQGSQRRGLGLAIANQRAHALGGSLAASSRPGHGCRVMLRFPSEPSKARP